MDNEKAIRQARNVGEAIAAAAEARELELTIIKAAHRLQHLHQVHSKALNGTPVHVMGPAGFQALEGLAEGRKLAEAVNGRGQ